jgi:hypothetical protein
MQFSFLFTLTLYKSKIMHMFVILFSSHMDNRCPATAMFVKEVDDLFYSFSAVTRSPDHRKLLRCHLASTTKHEEYWRSAADEVKTWTFLNKNNESMHPPPSQTGWLITIVKKVKGRKAGFVQHCSSIVLSPLMECLPSSPEAQPHQPTRELSTGEGRNCRRTLARKS